MNLDEVASRLVALRGNISALDGAIAAIHRARDASLNPQSYGVRPGDLILAPWAAAGLITAAAQVTSARGQAESLVGVLNAEIEQQRLASDTNGGIGAGAVASAVRSAAVGGGVPAPPVGASPATWWDATGVVMSRAGDFVAIPERQQALWMLRNTRGVRTLGALEAALSWGNTAAPGWVRGIQGVLDTKAGAIAGKGFGVLGAAFSVVNAALTWRDPESTTWDKTRDTISAGLAVTGAVLMFTPLAPIGFAIGAAGLAWEVGTAIFDNREAIGAWAGATGATIADTTTRAASAVLSAGARTAAAGLETAAQVTQAATSAASKVIDSARSFFDGITLGRGLAWP